MDNSATTQPVCSDPSVNEYRKHLWDALRAGQEQYDKYLLTLSGGGLAISLTLVKDVFGPTVAFTTILALSWALFCLSIIATIASFMTSQKSLRRHLANYEEYLATGEDGKLRAQNSLETLTTALNYASGSFFLAAVAATIVFASVNLQRGNFMANEKLEDLRKGYNAPQAPLRRSINDGYVAPPTPVQKQQQPKPDTTKK